MVQKPIDYSLIIKSIRSTVFKSTETPCILAEPNTQNSPRPKLPYFSFKLTSPGGKSGDDSQTYTGGGTIFNSGGQRKMMVQFDCYAVEKESAYELMALWQASLELRTIQEQLRKAGIAVWLNGTVADISSLLNTGYEARAQMDVTFGISSNITEDLGTLETVEISGDAGGVAENFEVTT